MKVSKHFLNDYIDLEGIDYSQLAEKMVFAGNEYESLDKMSSASNIVVGYVKDCIKHPESTKLHICQVDTGDAVHQILCGAPNITANRKVMVAKIGAKLPGGMEIKKAKLAGMDSEGMICSLNELGIEAKYQSEEDKKGIHFLADDAIIGSDAVAYLGFDDEVIDFELTADRGDLLSILGMAYEVGAIYDRKVTLPDTSYQVIKDNIEKEMTLAVETEHCPIYLGKKACQVELKESPKFMKQRLMASGIRPINNVVDISNYVMLEYGQPLHFFDADRLGNHITVRTAKEGETLVTLDGSLRTLSEADLVITNGNNPVALAGVMGGLETEIEGDTKNIFIESAIFDPTLIRLTSKHYLRSEASNRYEKGIDPSRTKQALDRACHLLEKYANAKIMDGYLSHDVVSKEEKKITITLEKINQVLGRNLSVLDIEEVARKLGFSWNEEGTTFYLSIPTRRMDVVIAEDFIEEVGRIVGYDQLKGTLPYTKMKKGTRSFKSTIKREICSKLQAMGLNQVITYSLVSAEESCLFNDHPLENVILANPLSEDKKVMRQSLIPSLLSVFHYNLARSAQNIAMYEQGSIYGKEGEYKEEAKLAGLVYGTYGKNNWQNSAIPMDFYFLKGVMEQLLTYLGFQGRFEFATDSLLKDLHPKKSCCIKIDKEIIGYLGQVHPNLEKKEVYVFELSIDLLLTKKVRMIKAKEVSKYPSIHKDVAFIVEKAVTSKEIMDILKKVGGRLLTDCTVFDVYEGNKIASSEKSLAYALTFEDPMKTLTDEEVTTVFRKMITEVEMKLNGKLRDQ